MSQELESQRVSTGTNPAVAAPPGAGRGPFEVRFLDGDPELMDQSHRLRYQVYCVERMFLPAENYPDRRECDAFDIVSRHVGVVAADGALVATARLVLPNPAGLPLFRYCTLFPHETAINEPGTAVLEVSRVSISRLTARRRHDTLDGVASVAPLPAGAERRRSRAEPFLTLLKGVIHAARRSGATHLIFATDAALHRWLVHYGFPYRLVGPEVDYYGPVTPNLMSLADFDRVVLSRQFATLDGFRVTPPCEQRAGHSSRRTESTPAAVQDR